MKTTRGFLFILIMLAASSAFAQGYRIDGVAFEVDGRTREFRLAEVADIKPGTVFQNLEELAVYIAEKRQLLVNERVLETVEIETAFGKASPGEPVPVNLRISVKDSWNLVVLPYFKYDSNTGLLLAGRGRDFNFLGTMTPLELDFNWLIDENGKSFPSAVAAFDIPFIAAGYDWKWNVGASIDVIEGGPADVYFGNGLTMYVPAGPGDFGLLLTQGAYFNDRDSDQAYYDDPFYAKVGAKLSYTVTLAETASAGKLKAVPYLNTYGRYAPDGIVDPDLDSGVVVAPGFDISFGRYDWIGNFRRGLRASIGVDATYLTGKEAFSRSLDFLVAAYGAFDFVGPSARLKASIRPDGLDESAGDPLRGILDARVDTDAAVFLNLDLPFKVIVFEPAKWFGKPWMRYFHFEQQWSPFLDIALGHFDNTWFDPAKGWYSGGLEIITYPNIMRSFYVRISVGFDLPGLLETRSLSGISSRDGGAIRELFFGLGHMY